MDAEKELRSLSLHSPHCVGETVLLKISRLQSHISPIHLKYGLGSFITVHANTLIFFFFFFCPNLISPNNMISCVHVNVVINRRVRLHI